MKNLKSNLQQAVLIIPLIVAMLSLGVMATATPGWSNTNMSARQSDQIQLSDMQPSSAWQSSYQGYQSQIFEVGTTNVPSDYSEVSSSSSGSGKGHIRKLGGGTDTGTQEQTSPIGEPWIMVFFALLISGVIAYRRTNTNLKHQNIMKTRISKLSFLLLFLFISVGQARAWTTYYLKSDNTTWSTTDYRWAFNNDGTTTTYMANGSNMKLYRTDWGDDGWFGVNDGSLSDNGSGIRFEQYQGNVSYSGNSGMVCFHMDQQTGNNNDHPWVWITRPTFYLKHNWGGGTWSWKALTDNEDGTYQLIATYGGGTTVNYGDNQTEGGTSGSGWGNITASTVGNPTSTTKCKYVFNSSNTSVTITRLCKITYDANEGTGTAPDAQDNIIYNTSTTVQDNTKGLYKAGYSFAGWNTKANGSGTAYKPGQTFKPTADITLYAQWTATDRTMYYYNNNDWSGTIKAYLWKTSSPSFSEASWPGIAMAEHQDKIYKYDYASSIFNKVKFNTATSKDDTSSPATDDLTIADGQSGDSWFYNDEDKNVNSGSIHHGWTQYIMVGSFPTTTVAAVLGEKITVEPVVAWADGVAFYDISITAERTSGSSNVHVAVAGTKLVVTATASGTATFTITYTYLTTTITKTLTVDIKEGIVVQAKIRKNDSHWVYTNIVKIHYWGDGIAASDLTMNWMKDDATYHYYQALVPKGTNNNANFLFYYDYMKDQGTTKWRQTNNITNVTTQKCYTISYSSESSHASCTSSDGLCASSWQVQIVMGSGEIYTSNIVVSNGDVISFFAPGNKAGDPSYRKGTVTLENNGTTVATLSTAASPAMFSESGIYTAKVKTSSPWLTDITPYTGEYYIRTDGASGGWDNYKAADKDNGMTYFSRNVNFPNETFSYYWVKNVAKSAKVNIKATVANDYNPVLCSFSPDENVTGDANGVNIRFGYEPTTNDLVRGILKGSTTNNFLNIIGEDGNIYKESTRTTCLNEARYTSNPEDSKLDDMSDWVYGRVVYAYVESTTSTASVVLKANFNGVHYLLGMVKDASGHETSTPVQFPVIKTGTTAGTYPLRVVYDFKTNRLFAAWAPEGTLNVSGTLNVDADVIFLRHEKEDVAQINIQNTTAKVDKIEHAIFALEVENDINTTLKNRELHYWITLPFDCKVSNIFGIGGFMNYWGIQRYNGAKRAQIGWFIETPTFWEWLDADDVMQKGEGYLLSIDKKALQSGGQWKEYGGKSQLTLYFPSTSAGFTITQASGNDLTITYPNEPCNITYKNRYLQDGNWKCIGTPGFKNITVSSYTPQAGETWYNTPPNFLYTFNEQTTSATYAKGTYTPTNGSTFTYHSFTSYMVQYAGTINWAVYSKGSESASIAARRIPFETEKKTKLQLDLYGEDGTSLDRTFVWLQEDATLGFDQNLDLNKIIEPSANQVYSLAESDVPFAANVLPLETDTVKLVVNITQDGEYIFSVPEEEHSGMAPVLYDMFKNEKINLLQTDYLVDLEQGKYEDRFFLLFRPEAPIVTSFETTNDGGQQTHSGEAIYDVLGRRVNTIYPGHLYIVNGEKRIAK